MRVERLDALVGRRLHHDPPAALERLLSSAGSTWSGVWPEMIEQQFGHAAALERS